jgi:hypothetical protein
MTAEYQFYHGALLHEIIVGAAREVRIRLCDVHGRPDAYVINDEIGLLIKHSSARITPWQFTFTKDHLAELFALRTVTKVCFVGLVCDEDGFVCIRDADLIGILAASESDAVSVRVDRGARRMYRVSSSGTPLDRKLPMGVQEVIGEIERRTLGQA